MQALAAISLRLESSRNMLISNEPVAALAEIKENPTRRELRVR